MRVLGKAAAARLPVLSIDEQAVFPGCRTTATVQTPRGLSAVEAALRGSRWLFLEGPAYAQQNRQVAVVAAIAAVPSAPRGGGFFLHGRPSDRIQGRAPGLVDGRRG